MWQRFTEETRKSIFYAQEEALQVCAGCHWRNQVPRQFIPCSKASFLQEFKSLLLG